MSVVFSKREHVRFQNESVTKAENLFQYTALCNVTVVPDFINLLESLYPTFSLFLLHPITKQGKCTSQIVTKSCSLS